MGEFWQSSSKTNDAKELVFHPGYKVSGPKRHMAAVWRQHTRLRALLVHHGGAAAIPYSICSDETAINTQGSWVTGNKQPEQGSAGCSLTTKCEAPARCSRHFFDNAAAASNLNTLFWECLSQLLLRAKREREPLCRHAGQGGCPDLTQSRSPPPTRPRVTGQFSL